jgi:hypothetical protein
MNTIKLQIIEPILIGLITVFFFFLIQHDFNSLIYLGIICLLSVYFFPIKLFNFKYEINFQTILSCFVICTSLILSYISFRIFNYQSLKIILLIFFVLSMYLMFYFRDRNKVSFVNHMVLNGLILMSYFEDVFQN